MKNDKISIIVPVYNAEKYLEECLDSLVNQTYYNIEIILVDDGSKDSSGLICDKYSEKYEIVKVFHIENSGVSYARNFGIKKSSGQWITFVDSDDVITQDYCDSMISSANNNVDLVIGRTISFVGNDIKNTIDDGFKGDKINCFSTKEEKKELYKSVFIDNRKFIKFPHISTCSAKLFRKRLLSDFNIQYDLNMYLYEDAFFNVQVINSANKIIIIDKAIYYYRDNQNSSSNSFKENIIKQYDYAYKVFLDFFKEINLSIEEYIDYFKVKNLNTIFTNYYKSNSYNSNFMKCILDKYKEALKTVDYKFLPKKRKLLKLLYLMHMNYAIYLLYKVK